uniref:Response regulator transcription factor n=1 Tax=Roseihalotalea indica TaxID=2867963 RepID=A0AA49GJ32_9BACT|nr:response regulator transcription factor [Tunicatimonas sp. TK19036]
MDLPVRLLIADDHPFVREALKLVLSDVSGIHLVGEVCNGQQVIEQVNMLETDVVLMDISMPECDGIQATCYLTQYFPHIKVLALTLHDEQSYVEDMLTAGARGFLYKTADIRTIIEAIQVVSTGRIYRDGE